MIVLALVAWPAVVTAGPGTAAPAAPAAVADPGEFVAPAPPVFDEIGVDEKRGDTIPLDLAFRDDHGAPVTLSTYFADGLPVVLTFNYSNCPQLCSLQLNGLAAALAKSGYAAGWHYHLITVILNPRESVEGVAKTKQKYIEQLPEKLRPHGERGWHFLLGDEKTIRTLAGAVGLRYKWLPDVGQYAHPALLTFLSSRGTINRYIHGFEYEVAQYDQSIAAAGTGTPQESAGFLHRCFAWDPDANNYSGMAMSLMRYAGVGCIALLAGLGIRQLVRRVTKESLP